MIIIFICSGVFIYLISVFVTRSIALKKNIQHRLDSTDMVIIFFPLLNSILAVSYSFAVVINYSHRKFQKFWKWFGGVR